MFFAELIVENVYAKDIIGFSEIGESIVFIFIAFGIRHILQVIGNVFESIFWKIIGGMPTQWFTKKNLFRIELFDSEKTEKIRTKIFQ